MKNGGKWTEGRYKSFVTSAIRGAFRRWPPKWDALRDAYVTTKKSKKGKMAKHYRCAKCKKLFTQTNVQVDHIVPIGSCTSWDMFVERLFCEKDNLQVLCKTCHKVKTKNERKKMES